MFNFKAKPKFHFYSESYYHYCHISWIITLNYYWIIRKLKIFLSLFAFALPFINFCVNGHIPWDLQIKLEEKSIIMGDKTYINLKFNQSEMPISWHRNVTASNLTFLRFLFFIYFICSYIFLYFQTVNQHEIMQKTVSTLKSFK